MVHQCLTAKFPTKPEAPPLEKRTAASVESRGSGANQNNEVNTTPYSAHSLLDKWRLQQAIFADRHLSQTAPEVISSGIPVFFKADHIADLSEDVRAIHKWLDAFMVEVNKKHPQRLIRNGHEVVATKGVSATP